MNILTKQGVDVVIEVHGGHLTDILSDVYLDYLQSKEVKKERDPKRLFVSDVGKCPREIALRMMQADKATTTPGQVFMWDLADYIERDVAASLHSKGLLYAYQADLDINDRENWGGRLDIVMRVGDDVQIHEIKTIRPNAFRYQDRPKKEHVYQTTIYQHYYKPKGKKLLAPAIDYLDRGGSNWMEEYIIEPDFASIVPLMDELDAVRDALPDLPPMLPKVLKLTNYGKKVKLVPDYRCGYCDYAGVSCFPDTGEAVWGEFHKGWHWSPSADTGMISEWASREGHEVVLSSLT